MKAGPPGIIIALDGPGITPGSVDGALLIRVADRYFTLLRAAAKDLGLDLPIIQHLEIVDKCAGVGGVVSDEAPFIKAHFKAIEWMNEGDSHGDELRSALAKVPSGVTAEALTNSDRRPLASIERAAPVRRRIVEPATDRHLRIVRVGGEGGATVRVFDYTSQRAFSLAASRDVAKAAGMLMFEDVLADVELMLDFDTLKIIEGRMVSKPRKLAEWTVEGFEKLIRDEFDPSRRQ